MIVPNKQYDVSVKFDEVANRWRAAFSSVKFPSIAYEFPLPDRNYWVPQHERGSDGRAMLGKSEEELLALTFSQMVAQTVASSLARQKEAEEVESAEPPHQSKTLPELARE